MGIKAYSRFVYSGFVMTPITQNITTLLGIADADAVVAAQQIGLESSCTTQISDPTDVLLHMTQEALITAGGPLTQTRQALESL